MKTLSLEPKHGWAIAKRIEQMSQDALQVQQGSLYPALYRLEQQGWIKAAARLLRHQLFGVGGVDAVAAAMSIGTMLLVGAIAVIAPARRLVGVDPMTALRWE